MTEPAPFFITIAVEYEDDVRSSLEEVAKDAGVEKGFTLEDGGPPSAASEMQFDPVTVAAGLWVGHIVLNQVGNMTIQAVIKKLVKKVREKASQKSTSESPEKPNTKIVLLLPDISSVTLDLTDAADVEIKIKKLASHPA